MNHPQLLSTAVKSEGFELISTNEPLSVGKRCSNLRANLSSQTAGVGKGGSGIKLESSV